MDISLQHLRVNGNRLPYCPNRRKRERDCVVELDLPRYDYCYWAAAVRLFSYILGNVGKLGYPNQILEGSGYFSTSIFRFSILELVDIDPHIAYVEEIFLADFVLILSAILG